MICLYKIARPLVFLLPAETAHNLTLKLLKIFPLPTCQSKQNAALSQTLWGKTFKSPVGLAAGFDKNAEVIAPMGKLGFGFIEVGTVTPKPQDGNPKPRIFRCPAHRAVINRMGFPNKGFDYFYKNFKRYKAEKSAEQDIITGLNIGINKDQQAPEKDYNFLTEKLASEADYLTINISSPNTPGLRDLQKKENLLALITSIQAQKEKSRGNNNPPLFVKLAPDLDDTQIQDIAQTLLESGIDGIILTNTTLDRPAALPDTFRNQTGGLSGAPVKDKATQTIRKFYAATNGQIPIIGCGGISNADDAYEKIKAGATLVQLYSALIYEGPSLPAQINKDLLACLARDGYSSIADAVGQE